MFSADKISKHIHSILFLVALTFCLVAFPNFNQNKSDSNQDKFASICEQETESESTQLVNNFAIIPQPFSLKLINFTLLEFNSSENSNFPKANSGFSSQAPPAVII
jgi:hypothetical protein